MTCHKILSEEKFFGEFYTDTFSDCLSNIYITGFSEEDNSSEYSSASDDVNIVVVNCSLEVMDREAWRATVHRVAKSWTQLSN